MLEFSSGDELKHIQENQVPPAEKLHRHESSSWPDYIYSPWSKEGKKGEIVEIHTQQVGEELGPLCAGSTATGVPHSERFCTMQSKASVYFMVTFCITQPQLLEAKGLPILNVQ